MATYMTWKEMYQKAYDPAHMDLGSAGTNAGIALRNFSIKGEYNPIIRNITRIPIEMAFFTIGDECSRVHTLWKVEKYKPKRKLLYR